MRLLIGSLLAVVASAETHPVAAGWTAADSSEYQAKVDRSAFHSGHASMLLKFTGSKPDGYAARQSIQVGALRGKRIRLAAWLKADQAVDGGAIWLRVDMGNGDYILDAMLEVGPKPSGWSRYALVSEVPADAIGISFGVRMKGKGEIRADDFTLEVVDKPVATTMIERRPYRAADRAAAVQRLHEQYSSAPAKPVNMGFENP